MSPIVIVLFIFLLKGGEETNTIDASSNLAAQRAPRLPVTSDAAKNPQQHRTNINPVNNFFSTHHQVGFEI